MSETANPLRTPSASTRRRVHLRAAPDVRFGAEPAPGADAALKLLERRRLSPGELRILLALSDGDVALHDLAGVLERGSMEIRRAAARLYARGFLQWRFVPRTGTRPGKDEVLGMTRAGRATVRPLLIHERRPR